MSSTITHVDLNMASLRWLATAGLSQIEQIPLGEAEEGLNALAELMEGTPSGERLRALAATNKEVIAEARREAAHIQAE